MSEECSLRVLAHLGRTRYLIATEAGDDPRRRGRMFDASRGVLSFEQAVASHAKMCNGYLRDHELDADEERRLLDRVAELLV
jgi:hypothetical protein